MSMRKVLAIAAAVFVLSPFVAFMLSPVEVQAATLNSKGLEVSGWLPYWREASSTLDVLPHLSQLTEINPFVYVVQPDGTIQDMAGIADEPWKSLIAAAKQKKVRVVPTVMWSDTNAIHTILSNAVLRVQLEDDIAALTAREGFDGIDIDFEGKKAEDKKYFSTFLKGLYQRMGKKWVMCTIESRTPIADRYSTAPPKDAGVYANDWLQINKYCDRVRFMTYDQQSIDQTLNAAQKSAPYTPVADVQWVEKAIKLAMQTISKKKIMIGVATYGYEWQVTPLSTSGYDYKLLWAFNPKYATDLAAQIGSTIKRNSAGELSFSYLPQIQVPPPAAADQQLSTGNSNEVTPPPAPLQTTTPAAVILAQASINILWWSDATAIKQKVDLAKKLGVRGVAVFKLDGGEDQAMWQVLK